MKPMQRWSSIKTAIMRRISPNENSMGALADMPLCYGLFVMELKKEKNPKLSPGVLPKCITSVHPSIYR